MTDTIERLDQVRMQIAALGYSDTRSRWLEAIESAISRLAEQQADLTRLQALERRWEEAPAGEVRRVRFDEDERPTWHVVDDRERVPLNEPKRVRLVREE